MTLIYEIFSDDFSYCFERGEVKILTVYSGRIHQDIFAMPQPKQRKKGGKELRDSRF